jgi:hypothetical protein
MKLCFGKDVGRTLYIKYTLLSFVYHYGTNTSNQTLYFEMFVVNGVGAILWRIRFLTQLR